MTFHIRNMIEHNQTLNQKGYLNRSLWSELRHFGNLLSSSEEPEGNELMLTHAKNHNHPSGGNAS